MCVKTATSSLEGQGSLVKAKISGYSNLLASPVAEAFLHRPCEEPNYEDPGTTTSTTTTTTTTTTSTTTTTTTANPGTDVPQAIVDPPSTTTTVDPGGETTADPGTTTTVDPGTTTTVDPGTTTTVDPGTTTTVDPGTTTTVDPGTTTTVDPGATTTTTTTADPAGDDSGDDLATDSPGGQLGTYCNPQITRVRTATQTATAVFSISAKLSGKIIVAADIDAGVAEVKSRSQLKDGSILRTNAVFNGSLNPIFLDKIAGDFGVVSPVTVETNHFDIREFDYDEFKVIVNNDSQYAKLFPSGDLTTDTDLGKFVGPLKQSTNLYSFIDEGVFTGYAAQPFSDTALISDDRLTFIHPNTVHTEGTFQYKCLLTPLTIRPDHSRFRIRAAAPMSNYEAKVPPRYTIENIKLLDPDGNLIIHYKDITLRGDADMTKDNYVNFATYSSAPQENKVSDLHDWQRRDTPKLREHLHYILTFDVRAEPLDDAFNEGFDLGFEEDNRIFYTHASGNDFLGLDGAPLSTQEQTLINPTKGLRISSVEICNSGNMLDGFGPSIEDYANLYVEVESTGRRIEKSITPSFVPLVDFDTTIFPSVSSVWTPNNYVGTNETECGAARILENLQSTSTDSYATLGTIGPHLDSGKLTVKFSYSPAGNVSEVTKGAFGCGFDQGICDSWYHPSGSFNTENKNAIQDEHGFVTIDTVTLKVIAKKEAGTRDYALDVVGYSYDQLLNNTPHSGGFLQSPDSVIVTNITNTDNIIESIGTHPVYSGFFGSGDYPTNSDDFALSTVSLSEKDEFFRDSGNAGQDHYSIAQYPIVSTTEFKEYEVPLKIYGDMVSIGKSRDYTMSSFFEHLFLEIYPLPSGASIASLELCIRYKPQDGLNMMTQGGQCIGKIYDGRSEGKLFPIARNSSSDSMLNAGSGYGPLSTISDIPHAYTSPSSVKSNYSRRWRGQLGTVRGPFDVDMFGFGFENPHVPYPFLNGYYTFDRINGEFFESEPLGLGASEIEMNLIGTVNYQFDIMKNVGWRFSSGTIFQNHLPGYTTSYETIDWTSYSNGSLNFQNDDLYGKIADAFDTAVRVSGQGGKSYLDIQSADSIIDTSGGFSMFMRFSPDQNVSGTDYNLFDSGVLFSKWDQPNSLDFALGYESGYLTAYAKDEDQNLIKIQDSLQYHAYSYPLSVLLTYNDHNQSGLKLYTDNEANKHTYTEAFEESFDGDHIHLRASSVPFRKARYGSEDTAGMTIGWAAGSGVGMNMFVTEFGLSATNSGVNQGAAIVWPNGSGTNIVESNPDRTYKQVTAQEFLGGLRAKFYQPDENHNTDTYELWDYVNEDTRNDWQIGDFKTCQFSLAFSHLDKRTNRDLISFNIKHHGSGYIQYANYAMPTNVDSGVAYHTQIENDFLRFHLSETESNFYSTHRRITKNVPTNYKFNDKALVVETVLEHVTDNQIMWPDCIPTGVCTDNKHEYDDQLEGPKLIVSLYTKRQEPYWTPDEPNWGLVNRDIHYLQPSSCLMKVDSKFDYDSLTDTSEQWALFPVEPRIKDFEERYFSQDVDDMFLQYDLVYPSGEPFKSQIYIHSAHVRLDDALVNCTEKTQSLNISTSGAFVNNSQLNLTTDGDGKPSGLATLNLNINPTFTLSSSGLLLFTSGEFITYDSLKMSILSIGSGTFDMPLVTVADVFKSDSGSMPMYTDGLGYASAIMPLTAYNVFDSFVPSGGSLPMFTWAAEGQQVSGTTGFYSMPSLHLSVLGTGIPDLGFASGLPDLFIEGGDPVENRLPTGSMSLFIDTPIYSSSILPLTIFQDPSVHSQGLTSSGDYGLGFNLFTGNFKGVGSQSIYWYNDNAGTGIEITDNSFASLGADNEIRGVDLFGFGSCTGDSPKKAIDPPLRTDDTDWREETCNEGGIFRATGTYTNLLASGFGDTVGYSGNYYGIRKYTGLTPNISYQVDFTIKTGNPQGIKVPRTFEEWEYGMCGPDWYTDVGGASGCCTTCDGDQPIVFSGYKLVGDYPSGNALVTPSGRLPQDNYGKSVSIIGDLMAVGIPKMEIPDEFDERIVNAGAIALYRRNVDVPGRKATWDIEDKLMLPPKYRRDYIENTILNMIEFDQFSISGQKWQVGQEGREFGTSVDLCSSGTRETAVVGAPRAGWSRTFPDITVSGIPVAMMIFSDQFAFNKSIIDRLSTTANKWDVLYKYFSAPHIDINGDEFQPEIDLRLMIFQLAHRDEARTPVNTNLDWVNHYYIDTQQDFDLQQEAGTQHIFDSMYQTISGAFFDVFPDHPNLKAGHLHSGIPPIVGVFKDDSLSAGPLAYVNRDNNLDVIDEFIDDYEDFSFNNGVESGVALFKIPCTGHVQVTEDQGQQWHEASIKLMNQVLATGYLIDNQVLDFITSGIGQEFAKSNAYEFQIPPDSGGRVYIFDREDDPLTGAKGKLNCVQSIVPFGGYLSRDENGAANRVPYGSRQIDRFGHAVSISKNSQVIGIGSPYINDSCQVFERNESENSRMYGLIRSWMGGYSDLSSAATLFDERAAVSGLDLVQKLAYYELSDDHKLGIRIDNDIRLYEGVFKYGQGDVVTTGTWQFILNEYLGTSRLGYSVSVNDDGDYVAFGAPTDSMNLFEDSNVWYKGADTWASYTNAGAVRIFGATKYVPHSGAVEFTRFGNLDRSIHPVEREQGFYDQMELYLNPGNRDRDLFFRRTEFSEIEIPTSAGLAFIITPELDAASDEIIDNIKSWLALGDRTLVLVGNDPVYEENGLYKDSNEVLNKILQKLGSRLRIHPADTEYESLQNCVTSEDVAADKYNVTKAYIPKNSRGTDISRDNIFAKGVGSIKINVEGDGLADLNMLAACNNVNNVCNLPIKNNGDLRAEWVEECEKTTGNKATIIKYEMNWPFHFDNTNKAQECDDYPESPKPLINNPNRDPVPVLTAAEFLPEICWSVPEQTIQKTVYEVRYNEVVITEGTAEFAEDHTHSREFYIQEDSDSNIEGVFNNFTLGSFNDPDKVHNRDCVIGITGVPFYTEKVSIEERTLSDTSILAAQEKYTYNDVTSQNHVVILGSLLGENSLSMDAVDRNNDTSFGGNPGVNFGTRNGDKNVLFYINMILTDCEDEHRIKLGQLGGWTGRTSFTDAYERSILKEKFSLFNVDVTENVTFDEDEVIGDGFDVLWIANPMDKPSDNDLQQIKDWLELKDQRNSDGDNIYLPSKLIITHDARDPDTAQKTASIVDYICESLGLTTRLFTKTDGSFAIQDSIAQARANDVSCCPYAGDGQPPSYGQIMNLDAQASKGCENGYRFQPLITFSTKVEKLALWWNETHLFNQLNDRSNFGVTERHYVPIKAGDRTENIIHYNDPIKEEFTVVSVDEDFKLWNTNPNNGTVYQDAVAKFTAVKDNGYRIFFDTISEFPNENFSITAIIKGATTNPDVDANIGEDSLLFERLEVPQNIGPLSDLTQQFIDVRALSDEIEIRFDCKEHSYIEGNDSRIKDGVLPASTRVFGVSGCPLPIITSETTKVILEPYYVETTIDVVIPARSGCHPPEFRPIKHANNEYCNPELDFCETLPNGETTGCDCYDRTVEIEDGPVIVAEEFENFSAGVNGHNRSKIVVVADSTIIQGQCEQYRADSLGENQKFIRSLYPTSPHEIESSTLGFTFVLNVTPGDVQESDPNKSYRQWKFIQKLRAPERGSPAKYYGVSGVSNTILPLYGKAGTANNLDYYVDNEDEYLPSNLGFIREPEPKTSEEEYQHLKTFGTSSINKYGLYPRYSGDFLNRGAGGYLLPGFSKPRDYILDAQGNGMPDLMKLVGYDYLDLEIFNSGHLGDLFGFSVDMTQDKLIVGTPFNAFHTEHAISGVSGIVAWHEIKNDSQLPGHVSGIKLSENGGAGAAFYFEQTGRGSNVRDTFLPWEFKQKIKPSSVNVGLDSNVVSSYIDNLTEHKGEHNLDTNFIAIHGRTPDRFGFSVSIDADMIAVGAPCHDFETLHDHIYSGVITPNGLSTAFQRKSFDAEFDIPKHVFFDLGSSGVRVDQFDNNSGTLVLNRGAVFNFRHELLEFQNKTKEWIYADKLYPQGHNDGIAANKFVTADVSGCENDQFGYAVAIDRANRGDGDYTLVVGSPFHDFTPSGDHPVASSGATPDNGVTDAGAIYTFDAMLREQIPTIPASGGFIAASVFGNRATENQISQFVYQNVYGEQETYNVTGILTPNANGDIFLEVSGFDPATKGFIAHRPFVESVIGFRAIGESASGGINMFTAGSPVRIDNAWPWVASGLTYDSAHAFDSDFPAEFNSDNHRPSGMSLFISGPESSYVYNSILGTSQSLAELTSTPTDLAPFNLFINSQNIVTDSGLLLTTSGTSPLAASGDPEASYHMLMFTSGIDSASIGSGTNPLRLRIRGK